MCSRRILVIDEYKREFERANSELTVKSMILKNKPTEFDNLSAFLEACQKVKQVCLRYGDKHCAADLQLWLRNSIVIQYDRCNNCKKQQGKCLSELAKLDKQISDLLIQLGNNIVPLKRPLSL